MDRERRLHALPAFRGMAPTQWVLASAAEDVKIWRSAAGSGPEDTPLSPQIVRTRARTPVRCVRFDKTGQLLGSCGDDGCVHITSVASDGQDIVTLQPDDSSAATNCFSFSSGSGYLSSGAADGIIRVWDTKQRRVLQRFDDHHGRSVTCMSFANNDAHIASGNEAGDVLIHGLVAQKLAATLPSQAVSTAGSPVNHLEYSRLRKSFIGTAYDDGSVYVWDVNATEKPHAAFPSQHKLACTGIAFSPVNHVLFASGSMDGNVIFFDVAQRKIVKSMPTGSPITCMSFHDDGVTVAVGKASGDVAIYDLRSARGNKPLIVLPRAHDSAFAPTGVRSIHFQRIRRDRSSRSTRSGANASRKDRSPASELSASGASVASSTGVPAPPAAAAAAEYDLSTRSSLRTSAASESSSTLTDHPRDDNTTTANVVGVAPPVFSAGTGTAQRTAASGLEYATSVSTLDPVSTPRSGLPNPSQTPQSAARQQKTEAFQAKTNALLAKLDRMSPAEALHQQSSTEEVAQGYGVAQKSTDSATANSNSLVTELAPGLAQLRAMQNPEQRRDAAAVANETARPVVSHVHQQNQDREFDHSRAARMSPPAATSAAANAVFVPPSLTAAVDSDAADARATMISPAAKPAQAQQLHFSSSESGSGSGAERVRTAWGSEEHNAASSTASGLLRSGMGGMGIHPNGSGIEPPTVGPTKSQQSQNQYQQAQADNGGAGLPAPPSGQDAALQVRTKYPPARLNMPVGVANNVCLPRRAMMTSLPQRRLQLATSIAVQAAGITISYVSTLLQVQVVDTIRSVVDESMEVLRASVHDEMQNIHLELVRQFHIQEHGFAQMLDQLDIRFER